MDQLSAVEARQIALKAQGFGVPRPPKAGREQVREVIERLRLVQIDSVNVFARAHYMPLFSRLGPYRAETLDELAYEERWLFEQWAHEACFVPMEDYPLLRHRMEHGNRWKRRELPPEQLARFAEILEQVRERGPVITGEMENAGKREGWWGWSHAKIGLEYQFAHGRLAVRDRKNFARVYDMAERVFPPEIREAPMLTKADAQRQMVRNSLRALGVATMKDLADYYRILKAEVSPRIGELVDSGEASVVRVEGWKEPAYLAAGADPPGPVAASTILSPFDPLVWDRHRTERFFGFHYRIEIYTPAPLRKYGYYVLPFLMNEQIAARVDLKNNRQSGVLEVKATHLEPGQPRAKVARGLARELKLAARWVGAKSVSVERSGDLAEALANVVEPRANDS